MTDTCTIEPTRTFARRGVEVGRRGVAVGLVEVRPSEVRSAHGRPFDVLHGVEVGFHGVEVG